jgi:hypothetical protein
MTFGNYVATFKVYPSGTFVIQDILLSGQNVTQSLTANRYVSSMIRFGIANKEIKH